MRTQVKLVGFGVREDILAVDESWSPERREIYLLRPEVARPLSTDGLVWPPVSGPPTPPVLMRSGIPDLWDNLDELKQSISSWAGDGKGFTLIAIGMVIDLSDAEVTAFAKDMLDPTEPASPEESWRFLGYDVSDGALLSGLSNCGFVEGLDDVVLLRSTLGPRLNEYGLFDLLEHAIKFRDFSNIRVPEHAPFFVYGIWLIPSQ